MSEMATTLEKAFEGLLRRIVREELREILNQNGSVVLLDAEKLAERLSVPVTWVYEQSRLGHIPTIRIGRYVRFDLQRVLMSQEIKSLDPS